MKNKLLKITSFVLAIAFALSMVVCAEESDVITAAEVGEEAPVANVEFVSTERGNGIVELDFKLKDTSFTTCQVVLRYSVDELKPINSDGEAALFFEDFVVKSSNYRFLNTVGTDLDAGKGLFTFTMYVAPGSKDSAVNENGELIIGNEAEALYTFRFKKIASGDYKFEVASEDVSKPYLASLKEGIAVIDQSYGPLKSNVSFVYDGKKDIEVNITPKLEYKYVTNVTRKNDAIFMVIGESASFVNGKKTLIDPANKQVVPYIKNERTLVPLRFVSESIGAEVIWEDGWDYCLIKKDDKEIKITFGSAEFEVNGEKFAYEAPIETVHDRTMVPVRFISEHLGYNVYWQELNQAVVITPEGNPWVEGRNAEETALIEVIVSIKGILP